MVSVGEPTEPTQPSLRRMRAFGVRPKRDLGQNFLIDSNILGVIAREAQLDADDVVLEIGGGLGVLSEYLAVRVAHVHVVELDHSLEPALRDATDVFDNVTLHIADAMKLGLGALDPAPTKVVANLPYGIAAGAILRTIEELAGTRRWVGMVQKEVGERFAAAPGTSAYGLPSVLAQLCCDVRVLRAVSRSVFTPVPNVDSVLIGLQRTGPAPEPALRDLVAAAFAHRRKALAGSLALAPGASPAIRAHVRAALAQLGYPPDVRAERLAPQDFRALHEKFARMTVLTTQAHAKINLCLFVGPLRSDDQHEVVTLMDSLTLADEVRMDTAAAGLDADEVVCPAISGPNLAADALRAFRDVTGWDGPPVRLEIEKRIPIAGGMGGGSADAAAALRLAGEASGFGVGNRRLLEEIGATLGADVASQIRGGLVLATGTGRRLRPLNTSLSYSVVVVPVDAQLSSGAVYAEADRLELPRDALELARSLTRTQAALSSETILNCLHNDLQDAARSLCPEIDKALEAALAAGADHALVSGSGPTVLGVFHGAGHRERAHRVCDSLVAEGRTPTPRLSRPAGPVSRG